MTQQLITQYQSLYFAWMVTRRAATDGAEPLAATVVDTQIDLYPRQVEAAPDICKNQLWRGHEHRQWPNNHLALYGVKNAVLALAYRLPDQKKGD